MKLKTIYIAALLAGCTNVNPDSKVVWKAKKDSISHRFIAYPYWYINRVYRPFTEEERVSYSREGSVDSVSERGGFGEHGMSGHGGAGE